MKVREAELLGFFTGAISSLTSFEYNPIISLTTGIFGVTSFIIGRKAVTGSSGGFLRGLGAGLALVSLFQQIAI